MGSVQFNESVSNSNTSSCTIDVPSILLILVGSAAALMNGLLILVLYNERKKFFRTRVSYLVANLAVADCFTGLMLVLVMALIFSHKPRALNGYEFLLLCGSMQISFYTLILMSLDRLIVAIIPMTWSRILTKRNTIIGMVFAWGFAIFGSFAMKYLINTKRRFALLLFLEITAVLFILIHVVIFLVLRRQRRDFSHSGSSAEISTVMDLTLQACHAQITSVVLTLMTVLIITYTPYIVFSNILLAKRGTNMEVLVKDNDGFAYARAFSYLNYAANPIVYAWRLRVYRKALCSLILKMTF